MKLEQVSNEDSIITALVYGWIKTACVRTQMHSGQRSYIFHQNMLSYGATYRAVRQSSKATWSMYAVKFIWRLWLLLIHLLIVIVN